MMRCVRMKLSRLLIYLTVFLCGGALMVTEIVAARLLAPHYGLAIPIWSGLIATVLAALSLGYYWGGGFADRDRLSLRDLAVLTLLTALLLIVVSRVHYPLLDWSARKVDSPYLSSILASILLFAPVAFLLAAVGPIAVRLQTQSMESVGQMVGVLSALSALGSIVGTLLAGLWLISTIGSEQTLFCLGILFAALTILLAFCAGCRKIWLGIVAIIFALLSPLLKPNNAALGSQHVVDTLYSRAVIQDEYSAVARTTYRSLRTDPYALQARISIASRTPPPATGDPFSKVYNNFADEQEVLGLEYTKFFRLIDFFRPNAKKALMIGGAAYSIPQDFLHRKSERTMHVVEIDPGMTEIARSYFGLAVDSRLTIEHTDGRYYLNHTTEEFDAVFMDPFGSGVSIPFQLATRESVARIFNILGDQGIVIVNFFSARQGPNSGMIKALAATYATKFDQLRFFSVSGEMPPDRVRNVILVGLKGPEMDSPQVSQELLGYLGKEFKFETASSGRPYTDDFAPTELMAQGIMNDFRRSLKSHQREVVRQ